MPRAGFDGDSSPAHGGWSSGSASQPEPIDLATLGRQVVLRRAAVPLAAIAALVLVIRRPRHR